MAREHVDRLDARLADANKRTQRRGVALMLRAFLRR
jgi:hypothetical protein